MTTTKFPFSGMVFKNTGVPIHYNKCWDRKLSYGTGYVDPDRPGFNNLNLYCESSILLSEGFDIHCSLNLICYLPPAVQENFDL